MPVKAGTKVSLILPESFGIISVELLNVATAGSILGVWRTEIDPPWVTSISVAGLKRSLTNKSETGSTVKPVGSSGKAVLPTALNVKLFDVAESCP